MTMSLRVLLFSTRLRVHICESLDRDESKLLIGGHRSRICSRTKGIFPGHVPEPEPYYRDSRIAEVCGIGSRGDVHEGLVRLARVVDVRELAIASPPCSRLDEQTRSPI